MSPVCSLLRSAAAVLILSTLTACGEKSGASQAQTASPPPEVSVIPVTKGRVAITAELPGRLQATRTAQVRARVEGIVQQRVFREGSDVAAGTLLFRIDPSTLNATVESAQAALAHAEADVAQTRAKAERYQPLLASSAISKQEYEEAVARFRQAQADVASTKAALTKAKLDLNYASVTAPISGRIGRAQVTEGALVGKGEATPLATIEQINPIYVNITQSSMDFTRIKRAVDSGKLKGTTPDQTRMKLFLEDGSEYSQAGKLLFSDLSVDATTGEVSLRAEFPNPERNLLPGMFVHVRLEQAVDENAIMVPQRALIRNSQGSIVMLVGADGKVTPQPVKVGQAQEDQWFVTEGLKGGEQVIVEGLQKVKPGMTVKAVPFKPVGAPPAIVAAPAAQSK
jgi:membrane fusion protein, multidrug efflux system